MGFSRQEYWSGLPFLSPGDLPDPGIEPESPALQAHSLPAELPRKTHNQSLVPTFFLLYPKTDVQFSSVQLISVAQLCSTLCDPMNRSMPGLPVHHQLPEFTQTQVHRISDAIQPSHPWLSPSPPAPNPSQNQSLFQ